MSVQSLSLPANSSVASMGIVSAGHLTKDGMMLYLQTRLSGVDDQIQTKFDKQKKIEAIRKELNNIQNELAKLEDDTSNKGLVGTKHELNQNPAEGYEAKIQKAIDNIAAHDPTLAATLQSELDAEGQILFVKDGLYLTKEVGATEEVISNTIKQLESSAQLEMIELQSLMSARQTAIQLATNLVSALGESDKAIVGNIGR